MSDNLKEKMLGAVAWSTIDRFGQQAVQFIIGLVLARLLSPDDYGLIGMIMLFVGLSNTLVDSGFVQALVRKQDTDETDYNSVFYFNILIGIALYLILYLSAPIIAAFYNEPKLIDICRVVFIGIIINALYLIPVAKMTKNIDYKTSAKINIISVAGSGILGICLAFYGLGVWALVAQQVLFHLSRLIGLYCIIKWKPRAIFSFAVIKNLIGFSSNLLGTSILNMIFNYIYVIIIGRFYPKNQVGFYTQANKLNETTNYSFQIILVGSTYALLAKIQDDDERFRRIFREIAKKTSLITFPVMLGLIAVAEPFITVLLTNKWLPSVLFFQLLGFATLMQPLYTLNVNALNARGLSKTTFKIEFYKKTIILISVFAMFSFGIVPMLIGYVVSSALAYLVSMIYVKRELNHYIKHQLSDFTSSLIFGSIFGLALWLIHFLISNKYLLLSTQLITGGILYLLYIRLFYADTFFNVRNKIFSTAKSLIK